MISRLLTAASVLAVTSLMVAGDVMAQTVTCWYGVDGNFTREQPGNHVRSAPYAGDHCGYSVQSCSLPERMHPEGDETWGYVIDQWVPRDDGLTPCLIMLMDVVNQQLE